MKKQVIEYAGVPVGIVVPDDDRLKFIAVKYHVHDLDEQHFSTADEVKLFSANRARGLGGRDFVR